jgi:hypothetical protein
MRINLIPIYKHIWAIKCPIKVCDENTGERKEKRKNGRGMKIKTVDTG